MSSRILPFLTPDQRDEVLARYNSEVARGIMHTPEWKERMAEFQQQFNDRQMRSLMDDDVPPYVEPGSLARSVERKRWWQQ